MLAVRINNTSRSSSPSTMKINPETSSNTLESVGYLGGLNVQVTNKQARQATCNKSPLA